jgi:hypothetical protein
VTAALRGTCPRCQTVTLDIVAASSEISVYRCLRSERQYARTPGTGVVDRWLSPVSLALYGVIYEPDAIIHAPRIATELARTRDRAMIDVLAGEMQRELDEPTQWVAAILDMATPKTEEHLREFLRLVVEHLRQAAARSASD